MKMFKVTVSVKAEDLTRTSPTDDAGFEEVEVLNAMSFNDAHLVEKAVAQALIGLGDAKAAERE